MRFSRLDARRPKRRRTAAAKRPVAKWVSNVAMQVTSKNNHKKFGNIWGCFSLKYRAGTRAPARENRQ
jgi:hypothetical protein